MSSLQNRTFFSLPSLIAHAETLAVSSGPVSIVAIGINKLEAQQEKWNFDLYSCKISFHKPLLLPPPGHLFPIIHFSSQFDPKLRRTFFPEPPRE